MRAPHQPCSRSSPRVDYLSGRSLLKLPQPALLRVRAQRCERHSQKRRRQRLTSHQISLRVPCDQKRPAASEYDRPLIRESEKVVNRFGARVVTLFERLLCATSVFSVSLWWFSRGKVNH